MASSTELQYFEHKFHGRQPHLQPHESLTVSTTIGFTPAGTSDSERKEYTLTADDNGNAYLYGKFEHGNIVKVVGGVTVQYRFTETTVAGKSYALFARRGANLAKMTETYVIMTLVSITAKIAIVIHLL